MATSDSELIAEARGLTDYDASVLSDSEFQELVDICKEELRADFGDASYSFYSGSLNADRALFWFVCVAAKIRTGEIGGLNITTGDVEAAHPAQVHHDFAWFRNFENRKRKAMRSFSQDANRGPTQTSLERDNREYAFDRPE